MDRDYTWYTWISVYIMFDTWTCVETWIERTTLEHSLRMLAYWKHVWNLRNCLNLVCLFFSVLDMACNDGHAEPQDAALKTLRLFCRNPRCRQVLVSLGIQQRLVRFMERSRMSGTCSQQSSVSSVPSTARTNDSVMSEHCVRILNKLKTQKGNETWWLPC